MDNDTVQRILAKAVGSAKLQRSKSIPFAYWGRIDGYGNGAMTAVLIATSEGDFTDFVCNQQGLERIARGAYITAALTICRAYIAAGYPDKKKRLASFEGWSDTVRSAIAWLGMPDPVDSMDKVRADDPETSTLVTLLASWSDSFGTGYSHHVMLRDVITKIEQVTSAGNAFSHNVTFTNPDLRNAVLGALDQRQPDVKSLGLWLRGKKDRIVGGMWFANEVHTHGSYWWVVRSDGRELEPETEPAM
jgi:hypothetical protein